jgi:hypothetical protein
MRRFLFLLASLLIIAGLLSGCGGDDGKNDQSGGSASTATPVVSDLAVTAIELDPAQIGVGQPFIIRVYVANVGGAPSGEYDLTIALRDVTRGTTSPIGAQHGRRLEPGQDTLAYETGPRQLDQTGSFQVQVTLTPAGPERDTNNNKKNQAFTVQ